MRRELIQKVRKSERKFKDVFNKSPLPIIQLIGHDLQTGLINDAAQKLYKASPHELTKIPFSNFNSDKSKKITADGGRFIQLTNDGEEIIVDVVINEIDADTDGIGVYRFNYR